jgi:hypothetical protein
VAEILFWSLNGFYQDVNYEHYECEVLYIPLDVQVKDYPGYNFIGLILGPRGNTQKRMEAVSI